MFWRDNKTIQYLTEINGLFTKWSFYWITTVFCCQNIFIRHLLAPICHYGTTPLNQLKKKLQIRFIYFYIVSIKREKNTI